METTPRTFIEKRMKSILPRDKLKTHHRRVWRAVVAVFAGRRVFGHAGLLHRGRTATGCRPVLQLLLLLLLHVLLGL